MKPFFIILLVTSLKAIPSASQEDCKLPSCVNGKPSLKEDGTCECACDKGYTGVNCDMIDACTSMEENPCLHGGTCRTDEEGGQYFCDCMLGFIGANCEDRDPCMLNKTHCMNGATCQRLDDYDFTCSCQVPFNGEHCENFNLCHLDPGECLDFRNEFGQIEPACFPCSVHTTPDGCTLLDHGKYQCNCMPTYGGPTCDQRMESGLEMSRITLPVLQLFEIQPHDFIVIAVDVPKDAYVGVAINVSTEFAIHISFLKDFRPDCSDILSQWENFLPRNAYMDQVDPFDFFGIQTASLDTFNLSATNFTYKKTGRHYALFWPVWHPNKPTQDIPGLPAEVAFEYSKQFNPERPTEVTFEYDIFWVDCVTKAEVESGVHNHIQIQPDGDCFVAAESSKLRFIRCDCGDVPYLELSNYSIRVEHHPEVYLPVELFSDLGTCWIIPWIVLACSIAYVLLLLIFCLIHWRSKRKVGFFLLADIMRIEIEHFYLLTVEIGSHLLAATTANVCCELRGPCTRVKLVLRDQRLATVSLKSCEHNYLFSTMWDMGELEKIRIWHDNYGDSPDWYISKVTVRNIKSNQSWYFCLNKWMSVSNYTLICSADALTTAQACQLKGDTFWRTVKRETLDKHLLLGLFFPSSRSLYTQPERVTVLFTAIFIFMVILILLYGLYEDASTDPIHLLEWGSSDFFGLWVVLFGLIAALIGWLVTTFLSWLFRNVWRRRIPTLMVCTKNPPPEPKNSAPPPYQPPPEIHQSSDMVVAVAKKVSELPLPPASFEHFRIPSTSTSRTETWIASYVKGKRTGPVQMVPQLSKQPVCKKVIDEGMIGAVVEIKDEDPLRLVYRDKSGNLDTERSLAMDICRWYTDPLWSFGQKRSKWSDIEEEKRISQDLILVDDAIQTDLADVATTKKDSDESRRHVYAELCETLGLKGKCGLDPCARYVLWILCICIIIASGIFTVIFGIRYGLTRSVEWTYSFCWALMFSIVLIETILALIYSLIVYALRKEPTFEEKREADRFQLIWFVGHCCLPRRSHLKLIVMLSANLFPPLTSYRMFVLRLGEIKKARLMKNLVDIFFFLTFVLCLIVLAFRIRTVQYFHSMKNLDHTLKIDPAYRASDYSFWSIHSSSSFYAFLSRTMVDNTETKFSDEVERDVWHEYTVQSPDVIWLSNRVTVLIGVIRLRQQRVGDAECQSRAWMDSVNLNMSCEGNFKDTIFMSTMDRASYGPNWSYGFELRQDDNGKNQAEIWHYVDADETESVDHLGLLNWYDGGGYVVDLSREKNDAKDMLKALNETSWIDLRTRVVFVEFTTFNPHANVFNVHKLIAERSSFNSWNHSSLTVTSKFYHPSSWFGILLITILVTCCLYFLIRQLISICHTYKEVGMRGLKNLWSWFDIVFALWGLFTCAACLYVNYLCWSKLERLTESNNRFVNLQWPATLLYYCIYFISVLLILALVKFWRLFIPSYRRWYVVGLTLRLTGNLVIGFVVYMVVLLVCFASFSHLAFGGLDHQYISFVRSLINLLQGAKVAGAMSYEALKENNRILGPIFYFMFNTVVYFLFINVIISVLTMGLQDAEDSARRRSFHTYSKLVWAHAKPFLIPRKKRSGSGQAGDLTPGRWLEMKEILKRQLAEICRGSQEQHERMKLVRERADDFVGDFGFHFVPKWRVLEKWKQGHMKIPPSRMSWMKLKTIQLIKAKIGHEYTAAEQKLYDDYNRKLSELRRGRLQRALAALEGRVSSLNVTRGPSQVSSSSSRPSQNSSGASRRTTTNISLKKVE